MAYESMSSMKIATLSSHTKLYTKFIEMSFSLFVNLIRCFSFRPFWRVHIIMCLCMPLYLYVWLLLFFFGHLLIISLEDI